MIDTDLMKNLVLLATCKPYYNLFIIRYWSTLWGHPVCTFDRILKEVGSR